jgi:Xaa-Pro aminopeptidase
MTGVTVNETQSRVSALRERLHKSQLDALVVSAPANIRYLSGFTGSLGYLLIDSNAAEILGDSRYWVQMEEEATGFTLVRAGPSSNLLSAVPERIKARGLSRVGFEAAHLTVAMYDALHSSLDGQVLQPTNGLVEELRMRKSEAEIQRLRVAARISSRAFDRVLGAIRPGLLERDVAFLLEQTFRELGADGAAFETIVAGGERGALPHARASERELRAGDMVVMDFGARAAGYHGDITRTFVIGEPSEEQRRAIEAVQEAQRLSLEAMRPGVTASEVDGIARRTVTEKMGAEACFGHGLGHGIGLEVHEKPRLAATDSTVLEPGMVVTNEPGVYIAGWGGVRLEEMVLVNESGPEVISTASRQIAVRV